MQHYASGFKNSLEEKRAMAHDLKVANRIQESMLPDQFKGLTDFPEINIFTRLVPAKGVAGDFFDHCFLPDYRFFFIVGDVSGKGIPAALYMVKVLTLLRTQKIRSLPLNRMFTEISNALIGFNEEGTFVTALGGILNYKTGELVLCDAGHNPPFLSKDEQAFDYFEINKNVPLGVVSDYAYNETRLKLNKKDALLLYTDGLPEAVDSNGNMFNGERIIQALSGHQNKKLEIIFNYLKNSLLDFVGKAKQADDITVFLLRYMK
jgi:sigma-B regulation protein RsbU (phosphoserine phosphatase)